MSTGFTLIEISIVLVIIGLIVGGILIGQNLIAASQLRAQVTQFEKFNQAANTFRAKYDCLPGDCPNATSYFPSLASGPMSWIYTNGNGDGMLTETVNGGGVNTTGFPYEVEPEPTLFWIHLFLAGLTPCCNVSNFSSFVIGVEFPQDMVNGYGISAGTLNGRNGYFWGITQNTTNGANFYDYPNLSPQANSVITPAQAQAFDGKIDDGFPTTGNVYAAYMWSGDNHVHPLTYRATAPLCIANTTPPTYNITDGLPACSLWINMQGGS